MSRVTRYKLGYLAVFLLLAGAVVAFEVIVRPPRGTVLVVILVLFLPGRIQGLLFRDFFRGRREADGGDPASALAHFHRFLETIRAQPWRKPALWLSWSIYTPSVEAMTRNNIGVAHLNLGDDDAAAVAEFQAALDLDPLYPIPHANLAVLSAMHNQPEEVASHLEQARRLGYSGTGLDRFIRRTQAILAAVESHGPAV